MNDVDNNTANDLDRRSFIGAAVAGAIALRHGHWTETRTPSHGEAAQVPAFPLEELTIDELQARMQRGAETSQSLAQQYLARIDAVDQRGPAVNAVIELNPDALALASQLDAERKAGKVRGPLHGIPVLIKDNIDTADRMHTTAGSLALADNIAARDSWVAARLRAAGAVILGKTNLSEWANFRSTHSTSGWSGRGGQTKNPYVLDRNPCGSSSGSAAGVAASLAQVAIGTETDGSIVCPSGANGDVGKVSSVSAGAVSSGAGSMPRSRIISRLSDRAASETLESSASSARSPASPTAAAARMAAMPSRRLSRSAR